MTRHGYTIADFRRVFENARNLGAFESACMRLQTECLPASDEGYAQLLDDAPSRESMLRFFTAEIDALRTELARRAFRGSDDKN